MAEAGKPSAGATGEDTMAEGWSRDKHFVDRHRVELIQRVKKSAVILDELFSKNVIQQDSYEKIRALPTSQEIMRELFNRPLASSGVQGKEMFYEILNKHESYLIDELRGREYESAMKVETLMTKKMLFETLDDLSSEELDYFKYLIKLEEDYPPISRSRLKAANTRDTVELMVETYNEECVDLTKKVLKEMNKTDLVQRLSDTSSGSKEKQWPSLIQRVETMTSVIELLLETLADLSDGEISIFKHFLLGQTHLYRRSDMSFLVLQTKDRQDIVFLMVLIEGQQSVETTKEVLKRMKRTDLVQRLSDSSPGPKKKHSEEHRSALIQKVATMAAVKQLLLETLNDLSDEELENFKWSLELIVSQKNLPDISPELRYTTNRAGIVVVMLQTYSQQSVQLTREAVKKINRTDLMQRLSKPSSELKKKEMEEEHQSVLSEKADVKWILFETLENLSNEELEKFKLLLQFTYFQKGLPLISWRYLDSADSAEELVDLMVENQQSVEVTTEVFMDMNRTDLVKKLSVIRSRIKEKPPSELLQKEVTMTPLMEKLLETLKDLSPGEFEIFKRFLQYTERVKDHSKIPGHQLETADRVKIVKLMVKVYGKQSVEDTSEILKKINRTDLVEMLSETSSGLKGPSGSLESEGCGSVTQHSSDWIKLDPVVNSTDADEAPTYSLESEAGHFECSISGLRWVCKEKVSFKYQFCSLSGHMERIESMQYMPAGPLMDITVIAGKLDVVYLPHWICIDDDPTVLDKFAVLHIDDCGDVVEIVSEVTSSHVKLSEPVFSLKMVLVKYFGLSLEINSKVLMYRTDTPFLKLHVYLIPPDPAVQQELDKIESSDGYKRIRKPHPVKPLKMHDWFTLTADLDGAKINPETLMLMYESTDPNFFEVFIKNPDTDFVLKLTQQNELQPVWNCDIKKDEYQSCAGPTQGEHFVDKHREQLIERANNIASILDALLANKVIQQGKYDEILAIPTNRDKMRRLYSGPLNAAGNDGKDIFYKILETKEPLLMSDLKKQK